MKQRRMKGNRWCELEVELRDGRLSICGSEGRIITPKQGRHEALDYWQSFFEEEPAQMTEMNQRCGTNFRSPRAAARYVVQEDGDFHGLDVHAETDDRLFITESCGQIVDTLREWFPEVTPFLKWHLNDMHAGCVHQDELPTTPALGEPCAVCGYKYGSAWTKRELPPEVVAWAQGKAT